MHFFYSSFCDGLLVTLMHLRMWKTVTRAELNRVFSFSLACMDKLVSMHSCRVCGRVVLVCMCVCYGLVTGTCLHSSAARGRLSKNNLNLMGVCALSAILFPLWPRLEELEVEDCWAQAVNGSRSCFTCMHA